MSLKILQAPLKQTVDVFNKDHETRGYKIPYENVSANHNGIIYITETMKFSYSFSSYCALCGNKTPCFGIFNIARKLKRSESSTRIRKKFHTSMRCKSVEPLVQRKFGWIIGDYTESDIKRAESFSDSMNKSMILESSKMDGSILSNSYLDESYKHGHLESQILSTQIGRAHV